MSNNRTIDDQRIAAGFKSLAHPHRLRMFQRLVACCAPGTVFTAGPAACACAGELGDGLSLAPSTVSHHLRELQLAGLVRTARRGRHIDCWIDPDAVSALAGVLLPAGAAAGDRPTNEREPTMTERQPDDIRAEVRDRYGAIARDGTSGCGCAPATSGSCCGAPDGIVSVASTRLGYSGEELAAAPAAADLGLGCGNPQAIAALRPGETVLDLGSGAGLDSFLAARQVGPTGRVIGVDMTPDMVTRARANARAAGADNVEFRLGEIEHLPLADAGVDVVISNCVVNLSPDKPAVWREALRVLRPGGRIAIADIVTSAPLPPALRDDPALHCACIGGAATIAEIGQQLAAAGFVNIRVEPREESRTFIRDWAPGTDAEAWIVSAAITAEKP
jgi:SAM-dependent methyltransferase/DNA-binding transcriptional ArsR family regulator